MATLIHVRSGRWRALVRRKGHTASKTFRLRTDAEKWARDIEDRVDRGDASPARSSLKGGPETLGDLIHLHIADMKYGARPGAANAIAWKGWRASLVIGRSAM
jgi:hypothetical protein